MKHYDKNDIDGLQKIFRLNLINSITGIKPANVIGTIDTDNNTNLAIISSVVHLGSNPGFLGFIMRPSGDVRRHTYENIMATKVFTINHVLIPWIEKAHYTSAKFPEKVSEFEQCQLTARYKNNFQAPYVAESNIQIGLRLTETIDIKSNNTMMIVGAIEHIYIEDGLISEEGYLDLQKANTAGISGLNRYYALEQVDSFPYARVSEIPSFD